MEGHLGICFKKMQKKHNQLCLLSAGFATVRLGRLFSDDVEKIRQPSIRIIADDDDCVDGCQKVEEVSVGVTGIHQLA